MGARSTRSGEVGVPEEEGKPYCWNTGVLLLSNSEAAKPALLALRARGAEKSGSGVGRDIHGSGVLERP